MSTGAGKFRERVQFQRRSTISDGMGNALSNWSNLTRPYWARISPLKGTEQVINQRLAGVNLFNIVCRLCSDLRQVTSEDRIINLRSGETYNIQSTQNTDERNIEITFLVKSNSAEV